MEIFIEEVRIAFYIQAGIVLDRRTEDDGLGKSGNRRCASGNPSSEINIMAVFYPCFLFLL